MLGYPPSPEQIPLTPSPGADPPLGADMQTPPPRADTPRAVHAGGYGQQAGGMHPTGRQSCLLVNS